mmetsp:Transcript_10166/g.18539  ORF Transcript_10166/g.18539 Transcript_10166/m.18539 type:complete len:139 (-) Transcript_10166:189-605(-)
MKKLVLDLKNPSASIFEAGPMSTMSAGRMKKEGDDDDDESDVCFVAASAPLFPALLSVSFVTEDDSVSILVPHKADSTLHSEDTFRGVDSHWDDRDTTEETTERPFRRKGREVSNAVANQASARQKSKSQITHGRLRR